jgi:DNA-binding GntR family transcriptional regulator
MAEVVHDRLRAGILRGEFDPHEPISQVQLAKRLGVSRTPLREALRMLQREGLIDSQPNRRVRVTALSVGDLEQLYAARVVVDSLRVRLVVPQLTPGEVAELRGRLDAMAAERDLDAWDVHHRVFHDLLKRPVGERLDRIAQDLFDHTERYRRVYLSEPRAWLAAEREHLAIFEACRRRDGVAASHQVARHLGTTALTIIAMAEPERDPAAVREALRMVTGEGSPPGPP